MSESETRRQQPCPICHKQVAATSEFIPFCSKRCKTIDLGKWANEDYRISRSIEQADLDE